MSAKSDDLKRGIGGHILDSIGAGRPSATTAGRVPPRDRRFDGLARAKDVNRIPVDRIMADPDQPRKEFDPEALDRLASSLAARGQLQPIRVWWSAEAENYIIIVGERRWRAARKAGLPMLTAVIHEARPPEAELRSIQLVENLVREDLRPIEQARAMRDLMDLHGYNQLRLSEELGTSPASVARTLALLVLSADLRDKVDAGGLTAEAGYLLSTLDDPAERAELAGKVEAGGLDREGFRREIRERRRPGGPGKGTGTVAKARTKPKPLPRSWKHRDKDLGLGLVVESRKGIRPEDLARFLRSAALKAEAEASPGSAAGAPAA